MVVKRTVGLSLLTLSVCGTMMAGFTQGVPEIDASSGLMAVGLLGGSLLVLRSWRKK
jgi:hypothetical protein